MKRILSLSTALLLLTGCASEPESAPHPTSASQSSSAEATPSTSSTAPETSEDDGPHPTLASEDATPDAAADAATAPDSPAGPETPDDAAAGAPQEEVLGFTEAPGVADPTPMNKTIASCGDSSLHETGTTFFTDGTSGWTQQCADQMLAAAPNQDAPAVPDSPAVQGSYVHPGAYCTGGSGTSKNGQPMTCAPASDGRMRWQSA